MFKDKDSLYVTKKEEKKILIYVCYRCEISAFNNFIEKADLVDILMVGRKFPWHKSNGFVKSRIDRVLVFRE